jgi:hypothetical protein
MALTRGSWNLAKAIKAAWVAAGLDDEFRSVWGSEQASIEFVPFNDEEARAGKHPRPYCIFEQGTPVIRGHSTGPQNDPDTEIQYQDVPVQFSIHASTKGQAAEYAEKVAAAFDKVSLSIENDRHLTTFRDPDFPVRLADKTWVWVLQYRFRIEADYNSAYS